MRRTLPILLVLVLGGIGLTPAQAQKPDDDIKGTIAYVQKLQSDGGGFFAVEPKPEIRQQPTLKATSAAVRALQYLGADVPKKEACTKFVASCFDKASGGFADIPGGKPDVFTTAVGIMALKALKAPLADYQDGVLKYLGQNAQTFDDVRIAAAGLEAMGKPSPSADAWTRITEKEMTAKLEDARGFARRHGGCVVTLLRLGKEVGNPDTVMKNLQAGQRRNGGYGKEGTNSSDLESTYRVLRAFVMLKGRPKDIEGVRSFVAKCRNEDGGYAVSPGQNSNVSATYFAAIIRHWLKDMK